jgi:hypothetical protein
MPSLIYKYVAAMLLGLALGFAGAWQVQNWRYAAQEKQRAELQVAMERESRTLDRKRSENVIEAQNAARLRDVALRRSADLARSELDGLRTQSADALRAASASHDACLDRARAFDAVLGNCAATYQELGATADRLVSDRKTLIDAWPK